MKSVIIHGQSHNGSTCHAARILAEKLGGDVAEFFLPRDFDADCTGCLSCFLLSEDKCPHYLELKPLLDAVDTADVIILASPCYVLRVTGAMKSFLDHCAYRFMLHRPNPAMFSKQGVCISTGAGSVGGTNKDMAVSMQWWGVGRIYKAGFRVFCTAWEDVSEKKKAQITRSMNRLARRIRTHIGKPHASVVTRGIFAACRLINKKAAGGADKAYWDKQGWLQKKRPWHAAER